MVKFFLTLFYIRLPSNVTVFSDIYLNQAHVLKAQNKCSQSSLFTQNQQIFHSMIISNRRRLSESCQAKKTFLPGNTTFNFPTFWGQGKVTCQVAHHSGIRIDHCRNNFYQVSLSEIVPSRDRMRSRWDLAYLIAGFGHNYPVPSSPLHAPRSGAHWPNRME